MGHEGTDNLKKAKTQKFREKRGNDEESEFKQYMLKKQRKAAFYQESDEEFDFKGHVLQKQSQAAMKRFEQDQADKSKQKPVKSQACLLF